MSRSVRPLFVCYVPGLDARRLSPEESPTARRLLDDRPCARITGLPDVDLVPSLITGTLPHDHGVWQVRLPGPVAPERTAGQRLVDLLPDAATTTVQGIAHALRKDLDLATIPPRRRRKFELCRFKYERRLDGWLEPSERTPSIFRLVGRGRSRYHLVHTFAQLDALAPTLPSGDVALEWLELYAFDLAQHWNLDRPDAMAGYTAAVDRCVRRLLEACEVAGVGFVLLSDHGQEPVHRTVDPRTLLDGTGVAREDVETFTEPTYVRFWFAHRRGRDAVRERLADHPDLRVRSWREMHAYGVRFDSGDYGDLYAYAAPGAVFFPHDFYQPVANLYMGLRHAEQRPRIRDPVHRGAHGYLPDAPSESGFLVLADGASELARSRIDVVDVAPTLLAMLGRERPDHMRGTSALSGSG